MLQCLCNLDGTATISRSLNHTHQFSGWSDFIAEIVEIVKQSIEVDFENSVVSKLL